MAKYDLKYRETIIQDVIKKVRAPQMHKNNRGSIVQLAGNIGVGKSAVMSHAIYYMMLRKCFTGGVIVIDLKKVKLFSELRRKLELTVIKKLKLLNSNKRQVIERADFEEFCHLLTDFFNQSDEDFVLNFKRKEKR